VSTLSNLKSQPITGKQRISQFGEEMTCLSDIYKEQVNMAVWQRSLSASLQQAAKQLIQLNPTLVWTEVVTPDRIHDRIMDQFSDVDNITFLADDIFQLVDLFCCLFELSQAGLRFSVLDRAMCPRFHVDKVPCRLITTYCGIATQWLPQHLVDRTKLGAGCSGKTDEDSGLMLKANAIQQLEVGQVALLKGENWLNNQNAGLVHRSPQPGEGEQRLLLTLDFAD